MLNNLSIELLKAKRTKSFLISILVMGVGFAWAIAAATRYLSNPDMHQISLIFYMIKEVNGLILPIVISLFVSRIVKNEKEGNTFKLLLANGENVRHIFLSKLGLTMFILTFLAFLEGVVAQLIAILSGLEMPVSLILWQIVIFLLASFVLTCLFLTLQFLVKKQALILALGISWCWIWSCTSFSTANFPFWWYRIYVSGGLPASCQSSELCFGDKPRI